MAIIYGRPDSEIEILSRSPASIKKVEDIETVHKKLKDGLAEEKKDFFEKVPSKINVEEQKLEKIKNDEKITEQKFYEKIKKLEYEKSKGGFSSISAPLQAFFVKNFSKRWEINKIKDLEEKQHSLIQEWKENPDGIFNKNQIHTITEIRKFSKIKEDPFHAGAKGELNVLEKLKQLSNDYHVLCGLNIGLAHPVTYRGKRRGLRSAQMDFVVVSKRGVVLIEVKNWSDNYANQKHRLRPHEQVDRAGLVLWIALKASWYSPKNPPVIKVLLSMRGNIKYDPSYKYVSVTSFNEINRFIENRQERFSNKEVQRLVDRIKGGVSDY